MKMTSYRESHKEKSVSRNYDQFFSRRVESKIWSLLVKPIVIEALENEKTRGAREYLDFATGTGRILKSARKVFAAPTAIDISENMLQEARARVPDATFHCLDVTRDNTDNIGTFDCVTLFRFIRNAEPELRTSVLNWLHDHMNDGGLLIVNNHGNSASTQSLVARLAFWLPEDAKNQLSRDETFSILESSGFEVEDWKGFRIIPTIFGRPIFGERVQIKLESLMRKIGLERFGGELVVFARRR